MNTRRDDSHRALLRPWIIAALVCGAIAFAIGDGGAGPSAAAAADQLAVVSLHEGTMQIFVVNVDGTNLRRMTGPPGQHAIPVWSPGGRRLAFVRSLGTDTQIYVTNADGSGRRRLTAPPGSNTFPAWSPDGRQIAFVSRREGSSQIYLMNADGSSQRRLTNPPGDNTVPAWSPDGQRLAFVSTRDDGLLQLYVMNADGTGQRRLTEPERTVTNPFGRGQKELGTEGGVLLRPGVLHPVWSRDGRWIAYVVRVGRAEQAIYAVHPDGTGRMRIATGYAPAWSPDGRRLAIVVARVGDAQIYVMDPNGGKPTRLTPFGVNLLPTWSPDGRWIAFLASRDGDLAFYVMNADGGAQRRLVSATGDLSTLPLLSWRSR